MLPSFNSCLESCQLQFQEFFLLYLEFSGGYDTKKKHESSNYKESTVIFYFCIIFIRFQNEDSETVLQLWMVRVDEEIFCFNRLFFISLRPRNFRISFLNTEQVPQKKIQLVAAFMMTPSLANENAFSTFSHLSKSCGRPYPCIQKHWVTHCQINSNKKNKVIATKVRVSWFSCRASFWQHPVWAVISVRKSEKIKISHRSVFDTMFYTMVSMQ